jgi:hypothetical protein
VYRLAGQPDRSAALPQVPAATTVAPHAAADAGRPGPR